MRGLCIPVACQLCAGALDTLDPPDAPERLARPRADISGVSGLGTLLSGAYIGVDAGKSAEMVSAFEGLESSGSPSTQLEI